jgi:hypothetical protein
VKATVVSRRKAPGAGIDHAHPEEGFTNSDGLAVSDAGNAPGDVFSQPGPYPGPFSGASSTLLQQAASCQVLTRYKKSTASRGLDVLGMALVLLETAPTPTILPRWIRCQ